MTEVYSPATSTADFLAGIELFVEACRKAAQQKMSADIWLTADLREGVPLHNHLAPIVARLIDRPDMARGFAAALGDYLVTSFDGEPNVEWYAGLTGADVFGDTSAR